MAIKIGERIPDVKLKTSTDGGIGEVSTADLCRGKKVVLFGVPGAFTGTCSTRSRRAASTCWPVPRSTTSTC
jgi:peroxiredoxin